MKKIIVITEGLTQVDDKFVVHGLFGETPVQKYEEEGVLDAEDGEEMYRVFDTQPEAEAYMQGINDMHGWNEHIFTYFPEHNKAFGDNISAPQKVEKKKVYDFSFAGTLAAIAEIGGRDKFYSGDTMKNLDLYIQWAEEFEKQYKGVKWGEDEGMEWTEKIWEFVEPKMKEAQK